MASQVRIRPENQVGIPYAYRNNDDTVTCPVCSIRIGLLDRKDFESHSGREYADHYIAEHRRVVQFSWGDVIVEEIPA